MCNVYYTSNWMVGSKRSTFQYITFTERNYFLDLLCIFMKEPIVDLQITWICGRNLITLVLILALILNWKNILKSNLQKKGHLFFVLLPLRVDFLGVNVINLVPLSIAFDNKRELIS